jgi:phosphonate transport system substrate-binding protein
MWLSSLSARTWTACVATIFAAGCARGPAGEPDRGRPKVLHFAVSIGQENPETEGGRLEPIRQYLERRMGMPVEVTGTSGYGVVIEAFRAKKIEAALLGPFAYVIGSNRAGIEAVATRGNPNGETRMYSATLSVMAGSPLHSIDDVIRHAHELTVAFVDPASTSGNLLQRVYLHSAGIEPDRDFKKVVYATQHVTSAMTLLAGKVDVAAVNESTLEALVRTGKIRAGEIRELWISPRIPEPPVAVRKDLPADFKTKLQRVLVAMASEAPNAYLNMSAKIYIERYRNTRWVPAADALYDPIRKLARSAEQLGLVDQ